MTEHSSSLPALHFCQQTERKASESRNIRSDNLDYKQIARNMLRTGLLSERFLRERERNYIDIKAEKQD